MRKRRVARSAVVLAALMAAASLAFLVWRRHVANEMVRAYSAAKCLTPVPYPSVAGHRPRSWQEAISLPNGVAIQVVGYCFVDGRVTAKYADEAVARVVTERKDYVYPCDLRLNEQSHLYVKADGSAAGLWRETELYEYDLRTRRLLRRTHVNASILPTECPMTGSAG